MHEPAGTVAIVVNWNGWAWTEDCLADLSSSRLALDIVVVDNGSQDDSPRRLHQLSDRRVETVLLGRNRGFGAGLNVALDRVRERGYAFVWLLNNDVRIPSDCHERLVAAAATATTPTVWTPDLRSASGEPQHVGGAWALDGSRARLFTARDFTAADTGGLWLTGTALFCAASTAARIGAFDESFFAYWEDVDWSFRAARAGVTLGVVPDAWVAHHGSLSTGGRESPLAAFLQARNEVRLLRKHVARRLRRPALLRITARQLRWAMLLERRGLAQSAAAAVAGVLAGLAGLRGRPRLTSLPRVCLRMALHRPLAAARYLEIAADRWPVRPPLAGVGADGL